MEIKEASFAIDIPILLPLAGYLTAWFAWKVLNGKYGELILSAIFGVTYLIAGGLYIDAIDFPFLGEAGYGNHFMWNSGIEITGLPSIFNFSAPTYIDFWSLPNMLAILMFAVVYPAVLILGYQYGRRKFAPPHRR
ncbi:hypothetical protein ACFL6Y_01260 [Elusimicrobiota bacterium]